MKFLLAIMLLMSLHACTAQKEAPSNTIMSSSQEASTEEDQNTPPTLVKIKMGQATPFGDKMVKLKKVTNDSRCPEGTQCIWAGEASVIVGLYEQDKLVKDIAITFSPKDTTPDKPMLLFESNGKTYSAIALNPYPKSDSKIEASNYTLTISVN